MNICELCLGPIYKSPTKWWHNETWDLLYIRCQKLDISPIHEAKPYVGKLVVIHD